MIRVLPIFDLFRHGRAERAFRVEAYGFSAGANSEAHDHLLLLGNRLVVRLRKSYFKRKASSM